MNKIFILFLCFFMAACATSPAVDRVVVEKSKNKMFLLKQGEVVKSYDVSLGQNPIGHKEQEGDMRTPEGEYEIYYKNNESKFYRSLAISYPNAADVARATARGVSPGGSIVIHGFPNNLGNFTGPFEPLNWTEGCIAVRNNEMDEMFRLIALNTPIEIRP